MAGIDITEAITDSVTQWGQNIVDALRQSLVSKDSWFDESNLAQSITLLPVETDGSSVTLKISLNDYYKYVDKGRGKSSKMPPIEPIENWITKRGIAVKLQKQVGVKYKGRIVQRTLKFKDVLSARNSMAFGMAVNIKRKGFKSKGQNFYSEVINDEALNELAQTVSNITGDVFFASVE